MTRFRMADKETLIEFAEEALKEKEAGNSVNITRFVKDFGVARETLKKHLPEYLYRALMGKHARKNGQTGVTNAESAKKIGSAAGFNTSREIECSQAGQATQSLREGKANRRTPKNPLDLENRLVFVDGLTRLPFQIYLENQKQESGKTWGRLSEEIGVTTLSPYVNSDMVPSIPSLKKISEYFGTPLNKFSGIENLRGMCREKYEIVIKQIGDYIVTQNSRRPKKRRLKLSTTTIEKVNYSFVIDYVINNKMPEIFPGKETTHERMRQIASDLAGMDDKYKRIEVQCGKSNRGIKHRETSDEERNAIYAVTLKELEKRPEIARMQRLPRKFSSKIAKGVKKIVGHPLSGSVISYYTNQALGRKPQETERGSMTYHHVKNALSASLDSLGQKQEEFLPLEKALAGAGTWTEKERKAEKESRARYFTFSTVGHQALVLYLTDPENYRKILGTKARLLRSDLNADKDFEGKLKEYIKEKIAAINLSNTEQELAHFAIQTFGDEWIRCDLIYEVSPGKYSIIEVKQNAEDLPGRFQNGTKAAEQTAAYAAAKKQDILLMLQRQPELEGRLDEDVMGVLVAYTIQPEISNIMNSPRNSNLRAVVIPKQEVDTYIDSLPGYISKDAGSTVQKAPEENKAHAEKQKEYSERVKNFRNLFDKLEHEKEFAENGMVLGTVYTDQSSGQSAIVLNIEVYGHEQVYSLNGIKAHKIQVEKWAEQGFLTKKSEKFIGRKFDLEHAVEI